MFTCNIITTIIANKILHYTLANFGYLKKEVTNVNLELSGQMQKLTRRHHCWFEVIWKKRVGKWGIYVTIDMS